jgi:glyoxylase-like metal-dependent hydrolase (beta-lactamase superfamily II)
VGHPALIDLNHLGRPRVLAAYLLDDPVPTLIDCGPATCLGTLEQALADRGIRVGDLRHLLLTHIHLDHAGAAGALVRANPRLMVHVSEAGAPHVLAPDRLERSARRLFGDDFDRLWGSLAPVPRANLRVAGGHVAGLDCFPTPGHAIHHVSFLGEDGSCFTGDVTGIRIPPWPEVVPGTPPPDIDLDAYDRSLTAIAARRPERLCLSHFGGFDDVEEHLARARDGLARWSGRVRGGATMDEFVAAARADLKGKPDALDAIEAAAPFEPSFAGLDRYWATRRRAAASMTAAE